MPKVAWHVGVEVNGDGAEVVDVDGSMAQRAAVLPVALVLRRSDSRAFSLLVNLGSCTLFPLY